MISSSSRSLISKWWDENDLIFKIIFKSEVKVKMSSRDRENKFIFYPFTIYLVIRFIDLKSKW